eukprot:scaffold142728_cov32-Tisochrysis_lutea.AAC.4
MTETKRVRRHGAHPRRRACAPGPASSPGTNPGHMHTQGPDPALAAEVAGRQRRGRAGGTRHPAPK